MKAKTEKKINLLILCPSTACSCNDDYSRGVGCNVETGQCECLPGVVGDKCNACPYRWVLVEDQGCHECDICHHSLLDVTDSLAEDLDEVITDFQTVARTFFTSQKLKYFNNLSDTIEPAVRRLDPNGVNLTPLSQRIDTLEADAKNFERKLHYANETVLDQLAAGSKLVNDSNHIRVGAQKTLENIQDIIYEVQNLANSFDASESTKVDALSDAKDVLRQLNEMSIDTMPSEKQLENATNYLAEIERFVEPVKNQNTELENLRSSIGNFSKKLDDVNKNAARAIELSREAEYLHSKNQNATVNGKFETVNNHTKETQNNIDGTAKLGKDGEITLGEIFRFSRNLENVNNQLKVIAAEVHEKLPKKETEYDKLEDIIANASDHREQLADTVNT